MLARSRNRVEKTCAACGESFSVPNYRKDTAKFCSILCQNHKQYEGDRKQYTCYGCKSLFWDSPSRLRRKFCSMDCKSLVSETTKERRKKQKISAFISRGGKHNRRSLRNLVFSVKPKVCESCGYYKRTYCLDVHHIDKNPDNNVIENLAILCVMCHRELHKGDLENAFEKRFLKKSDF
jgi:hypothetical protein